MVARFSECVGVSNWLPHTPVQIFFRLVLVHKTVWCSLSSSNIQSGVLAGTFCITLFVYNIFSTSIFWHLKNEFAKKNSQLLSMS